MKSVAEMLAANIGRALRAHEETKNTNIPKSQRDFHAGRREAYLQNVALIVGSEVKDIRADVLGTKGAEESVKRTVQLPSGRTAHFAAQYPDFEYDG